jgi:hypothetical protein
MRVAPNKTHPVDAPIAAFLRSCIIGGAPLMRSVGHYEPLLATALLLGSREPSVVTSFAYSRSTVS